MVQDVTDHQSQMHRVKVKDTPMEEVVIGQKAEQCLGIEKNLKKQRCIMDRIVNRQLECIFLFSPKRYDVEPMRQRRRMNENKPKSQYCIVNYLKIDLMI
eukprot:518593_1